MTDSFVNMILESNPPKNIINPEAITRWRIKKAIRLGYKMAMKDISQSYNKNVNKLKQYY